MADKDFSEAKLLVVDDEKLIRLTISAKLKRAGYEAVAVETVNEAVEILKKDHSHFGAIISDIVMGTMDGFVFRDIVRGIDKSMPFFFMTALDPEEGSGFLKRIVSDPVSYYLPKSVSSEVLINRVKRVIASRRIEQFIQRKIEEDRQSLELAAHVQRSLLPRRAIRTPRGFYSMWWRPKDIVSGDLFEAVPFGKDCYLFVLGDIQGHGTSAALAMTAVQSYLKRFNNYDVAQRSTVLDVANALQRFFRVNLTDVSYMTALICAHTPLKGVVEWISCGAPDLIVYDKGSEKRLDINPEQRGGLPIGLMPDTVYTANDVVRTPLSRTAVCFACTDGLHDLSSDPEGMEKLPNETIDKTAVDLIDDARTKGSEASALHKFVSAIESYGYDKYQDDMTLLTFGATLALDGIYSKSIDITPDEIDASSQEMAEWCAAQSWPDDLVVRLRLVFEEKLMNIYDHGFDERDRMHEVASIRLVRVGDEARLTVWECGTPEPSLVVAAGDADVAFELKNREMNNHGRGRLIVREICTGIEKNRYCRLNETIYHVPFDATEKQKMEANNK